MRDPAPRSQRSDLPQHASVHREAASWVLTDSNSRNGILVDGERRTRASLRPGQELQIGGLTLIAESPRLIALRSFLLRILGWWPRSFVAIDLALRSIRTAQAQRAALTLRGVEDLVPLAHILHSRVIGPDHPFIVCDPRRKTTPADIRSPTNIVLAEEALGAARGGSLCIRWNRLPKNYELIQRAARDPDAGAQMIVCRPSPTGDSAESLEKTTIEIPPLSARGRELPQIIYEYLVDAAELFEVTTSIYEEDLAWILEHSARSFHEIDKGAHRLTALRITGSVPGAADLLRMAPVSLRRWIGRRSIPAFRASATAVTEMYRVR